MKFTPRRSSGTSSGTSSLRRFGRQALGSACPPPQPPALHAPNPPLHPYHRPPSAALPPSCRPQIPLSDIFKLEVASMKGIEDYMAVLSKKGRWNFKDRQKK